MQDWFQIQHYSIISCIRVCNSNMRYNQILGLSRCCCPNLSLWKVQCATGCGLWLAETASLLGGRAVWGVKSLLWGLCFSVFWEIRNKQNHRPCSQSALRLYNSYNLCPCTQQYKKSMCHCTDWLSATQNDLGLAESFITHQESNPCCQTLCLESAAYLNH